MRTEVNQVPCEDGHEQIGAVFPLLLVLVIVAAFWRSISLPFVQDDWGWLASSSGKDLSSLISEAFNFEGELHYRPAGIAYLYLLFKTFGSTSWPAHVIALIIHGMNSFLVFLIMKRIAQDKLFGMLSSLIYASAVSVHLDILCWAVGIYDLGAAFFFFSAILLFLSGRSFFSCLCFLVGALFKESIVVLPGILLAIAITRAESWSLETILRTFKGLLPHFVVAALILGLKLVAGVSPLALPESHPYFMKLYGSHILTNLNLYAGWMLQSLLPFGTVTDSFFQFILNDLIIVVVILSILGRITQIRLLIALSLWLTFSLLPVVFMPNHTYRYYAIYSLPAFVGWVLVILNEGLAGLVSVRTAHKLLTFIFALMVGLSIYQSNRIFAKGPEVSTLQDGTNPLIKRAALVELVNKELLKHLPSVESEAIILLGGVDLWSFHKNSGPRFWYKNSRLQVFRLEDLRVDTGGLFLQSPVSSQAEIYTGAGISKIPLRSESLYAFKRCGSELEQINPKELELIAARQSSGFASSPEVGLPACVKELGRRHTG